MKNIMKRTMLLVVTVMLSTVLFGCSSADDNNSSTDTTNSNSSSSTADEPIENASTSSTDTVEAEPEVAPEAVLEYNGTDYLVISEEGQTVTLFSNFGGNGAPEPSLPMFQKSAEITGISIENIANPSIPEETQSLNTMIAGGKLPDIIHGHEQNIKPLVTDGAFIPLDDLIDQYAPNIKRYLELNKTAQIAGTGSDGNFYLIYGTLGGDGSKPLPSMGWFIRKDWLDKLGLKTPETVAEFEEALYAFRNNDPNGNGEKDEIPFIFRMNDIYILTQLFDVVNNYYEDSNGVLQFPFSSETYKNCMINLARWYADGIIDPEIFTRGGNARQELFGNNTGGSTFDWFASTGAINDNPEVLATVPDINLVPILPPTTASGNSTIDFSRAPIHTFPWGISIDCKDPVTVIRYMDFWMSETGYILYSYGIEGVDYTMIDGVPVPTEEALHGHAEGYPNYLRSIGCMDIGAQQSLDSELFSMSDQAKAGFNMYLEGNVLNNPYPVLSYTEAESEAINRLSGPINDLVNEWKQQALMGAVDIEAAWDKYVRDLDALGLQERLEIERTAYDRYKALAN